MEGGPAEDAGEQRADEDAELGVVEQQRCSGIRGAEGEVCDEEGYREADTAEQGDGGQTRPVHAFGHRSPAQQYRQGGKEEDAEEFTADEAHDDSGRYTVEELIDVHAAEVDAGVGEGENRHYQIVHQRMQGVFHILKR